MLLTPQYAHLVRSGSYLFTESGSTRLYSDATSIRSLASIGMGSTDGRRMVIRKVPNSPSELLSYISPPTWVGVVDYSRHLIAYILSASAWSPNICSCRLSAYLKHWYSDASIDFRQLAVPLSRLHIRLVKKFFQLVLINKRFAVCNEVKLGLVCFGFIASDKLNERLMTTISSSG